jgi:ribosomal protein S27AE
MTKITAKCVECGNKKEYEDEYIPRQQPFCEFCGGVVIAESAEFDTREKKKRPDGRGGLA